MIFIFNFVSISISLCNFFSFKFPKILLLCYFVTSYDFQSVNNVLALLPLCYFVTCMSYSLKKVINYFSGKKDLFTKIPD